MKKPPMITREIMQSLLANRISNTKLKPRCINAAANIHSLHSLFAKSHKNPTKTKGNADAIKEESTPPKEEISPQMASFLKCLLDQGYLGDANFLQERRLDSDSIYSSYAQHFLKTAAQRFGLDHQDIAKWLSGRDLKNVALFGCPSAEKRTVFAAKRLRTFFDIDEYSVCQPCKLKFSCKFANQRVDKMQRLDLADALRVLTVHASNSSAQKLPMSNETKASINKLLNEVVNLSQ